MENLLIVIATFSALVALIQTIRLKNRNMITAQNVRDLVNALNTALMAEANDVQALADAKATIASMTAADAALADPALQTDVETALTNASAANPPPAPPAV